MKLTIAMCVTSIVFICSPVFAEEHPTNAWSKGSQVRIRSNPSLTSNVIGKLETGEKVRVIGKSAFTSTADGMSGSWSEVVTSSGTKGWVFGNYLDPDPATCKDGPWDKCCTEMEPTRENMSSDIALEKSCGHSCGDACLILSEKFEEVHSDYDYIVYDWPEEWDQLMQSSPTFKDIDKARHYYSLGCNSVLQSQRGYSPKFVSCLRLAALEFISGDKAPATGILRKVVREGKGYYSVRTGGEAYYDYACDVLGGIYLDKGKDREAFSYSQVGCNGMYRASCERLEKLPDYSEEIPMGVLPIGDAPVAFIERSSHSLIEPLNNPRKYEGSDYRDGNGLAYLVISRDQKGAWLRIDGKVVNLTFIGGDEDLEEEGSRWSKTFSSGGISARMDFIVKMKALADYCYVTDVDLNLTVTASNKTETIMLHRRSGC